MACSFLRHEEVAMKGADEYFDLFRAAEQHGRLYLCPGHHARGKTFRIFVLPAGEKAKENGPGNPPLNMDAVEVYGVVGGNPGWTESYGWLHQGKWVQDFQDLVKVRQEEERREQEQHLAREKERLAEKEQRIKNLLSTY
jgi:hypothetical protein